jgi:hypothetical protein
MNNNAKIDPHRPGEIYEMDGYQRKIPNLMHFEL